MKAETNIIMYSFNFPKGKLFEAGDEIPEEFVDTPVKLGINRLDTEAEVEKKCAEGLKKGIKQPKVTIENVASPEGKSELDYLKVEYEVKFGKKPFHLMKEEGLRKALENDS